MITMTSWGLCWGRSAELNKSSKGCTTHHPVGGDNFHSFSPSFQPDARLAQSIVDAVIRGLHRDAAGVVLGARPLALFHFFFTRVGLFMGKIS